MKFELNKLEALAYDLTFNAAPAADLKAWQEEINTEKERIIKAFGLAGTSGVEEDKLKDYLQYHCLRIYRLRESLFKNEQDDKSKMISVQKEAMRNTAEELLFFLKLEYSRYMGPIEIGSSNKVITTLSVEELALFCRLFIETGIFRVKVKMDLARFMSANVTTVKKRIHESLSVDHFYDSLFTVNVNTVGAMERLLNKMKARLVKIRSNTDN
jgi:hypothetical protein